MELSLPTKKQWMGVLKAAVYVGISAILDYLISLCTGTTFGTLTPIINIILVALKKLITKG